MIINSLTVRFLGEPRRKPILFNPDASFFVSSDNSQGKTTLIRLIEFALCFNVPLTKGLRAKNIETIIEVKRDDTDVKVIRSGTRATLLSGQQKIHVNLLSEGDFSRVASFVFGIRKPVSNGNLLGTISIDQDNGWNLLSAGKVTGELRFNAAELISDFFSIDTLELDQEISALDKEIKKYQLIGRAMEFKAETVSTRDDAVESKPEADRDYDKFIEERNRLIRRKKALQNNISRVGSVIQEKKNIASYLGSLHLMVREAPGKQPFILTEDNLFLKDLNVDGLIAQKMLYESELRAVMRKLEDYPHSFQSAPGPSLFDINKASTMLDTALSNLPDISNSVIQKTINELKAQKANAVNRRREFLMKDESASFLERLSRLFSEGLAKFGLREKVFDEKDIKVESYQSRGRFSGAELAKISLCYRLAMHKCFCDASGEQIPLIVDSPGSKELKENTVQSLIDYALDYSRRSNVQIIISTIKTELLPLNDTNSHWLRGRAMDLFIETGLFED